MTPRQDDPRPTTRARSAWLVLRALVGLALVAAPAWTVLSTGDAVAHQHVTLALLLGASALAGVVLLVATARASRRRTTRPARRPVLRAVAAGAGLVLLAVLAGAAAWLRPFPATSAALDALAGDDAVEVRETSGWYAFVPRGAEPATGLVYSPGARVDVRATAAVLRPLAEAGYLVVALKEPLGIALTSPDQSASAIAAFDGVRAWVVGGHSLGGVAASSFAAAHDDVVDGLLLHASYPLGDLADAGVRVTSVWASRDGLTTADDVEASRADLPAGTTFVEVPGAVHAYFADYGPQPGDGTPGVSRADAQAQIVDASLAALAAVAP
ncbi:alpha/beta hydrolase [Cellulomonas sp. Marseille-Q8402]